MLARSLRVNSLADVPFYFMTKNEWTRLYGFYAAKKKNPWRPIYELKGRRLIKGKGKGVGQVLKNSKVTPQIPLLESV